MDFIGVYCTVFFFFLLVSVFTAGKNSHNSFCCTVLSGLSSYHGVHFCIPTLLKTFTMVIYHFSVLGACSSTPCWKKPQLVAPLFLLLLVSSASYSFLRCSFFPSLFFFPNIIWHAASRTLTGKGWLFTMTVNFMLLLYAWISREDKKQREV